MTFDKSKVCVAGLHDVPVGTKGYFSDEVYTLRGYINDEDKCMYGTIIKEPQDDWYKLIEKDGNTNYYRFFYPCEEKKVTYRPYRTLEEAERAFGKVVRRKDESGYMLITCIRKSRAYVGDIEINNGLSVAALFEQYTFEDGSPVGVEV